jgi:acid phosphatase
MQHAALAVSLLSALLSACVVAPVGDPNPPPVVVGAPGATVCADRNGNARCDTDGPRAVVDAAGLFEAPAGSGALLAESTADANARPVVLRAPPGVKTLSAISTELVALMEADGSSLATASAKLSKRIGVPEAQLLMAPDRVGDARMQAALRTENARLLPRISAAVVQAGTGGDRALELRNRLALDAIETIVVIYAENRSFDNMYGLFPGANGIPGVNPSSDGVYHRQRDFDGKVLPVLPPVWGGLTADGQPVTLTQAQTTGMANQPFQIDAAKGVNGSGVVLGQNIVTRDLVHRYYSNILQINGGRSDGFAAYSDAGALTMGYYDGSATKLWKLAQRYTLADNFFMGAFGGSFLNHQYLICACAPVYPNADAADSPAKERITQIEVDAQGRFKRLAPAENMPASALVGPPRYKRDNSLTPKDADGVFHAVNTMQPPYQPSDVAAAPDGDARYADRGKSSTLPPQAQLTIGDTLEAKGVSWAWYAGGWNAVNAGTTEARKQIYGGSVNFQPHHQPFNYYAAFDPATRGASRSAHLKDFDGAFLADAANGKLPAVAFYKPQGALNQHPGYTNLADGDAHIAEVIEKLQQSPQWKRMLIVVAYDENGGFYDHAAVPAGDRWGPGTRIPAIIVSPFAKKGFVDNTPYDTGSILRFITNRWSLAALPGIVMRDQGLQQNGSRPMGDLSSALEFGRQETAP